MEEEPEDKVMEEFKLEKDKVLGEFKPNKNDWMIYIMCVITIIICIGYYSYVQNNLDKAMDECNEFWDKQFREKCSSSYNQIAIKYPPVKVESNFTNMDQLEKELINGGD